MTNPKKQELELRVLELIEEFEDKLESAPTVPLTGKILVDRQDLLSILKDIQTLLPDEYQHVRWIKSQKDQIIEEANTLSQELINNARHEELRIIETAKAQENDILTNASMRSRELIDENDIVRKARALVEQLLNDAEEKAEDIRRGSYEYAEEIMKKVEYNMSKVLHTVKENIDELDEYK